MASLPHFRIRRAFAVAALGLMFVSGFAGESIFVSHRNLHFQDDINSYGGATSTFFFGLNVNQAVGATTFYSNGYTGSRSILANIEGGYVWSGHPMTSKATYDFAGTGALGYSTTSNTEHATGVGGILAGNADYSNNGPAYKNVGYGLAYDAALWSGNVADTINGDGSFSTPTNAIWNAYNQAINIGSGTKGIVDVVNSSWGFTSTDAATQGQLSAGNVQETVALDALIATRHKLVAISAGNNGTVSGAAILHSVGGLAAGFNNLTVGSLGPNNHGGNYALAFTSRSSFSAYGPGNYYDPNSNSFIAGVRAKVDIAAPGEEIDEPSNASSSSFWDPSGTSMSSPITAGSAALLVDEAKAKGWTSATDERVLGAVMMNSADKQTGWTNGTTLSNGVYGNSQALDYQTGAGKLNLTKAYHQLNDGTTDVAGQGGGTVKDIGWDLGTVALNSPNTYLLSAPLVGGTTLTATLRWEVNNTTTSTNTTLTDVNYGYFSHLRLEVWNALNGTATSLLAYSDSIYINKEHIYVTVPTTGMYALKVSFLGQNYNFTSHANSEAYGLAWSGTPAAVPEPATFAGLAIGAVALLRRRRK